MENKLEKELDNWNSVKFRMKDEGIEYCFKSYSRFDYIDDEEFHNLRIELISNMDNMLKLINNRISNIEDKLKNLED